METSPSTSNTFLTENPAARKVIKNVVEMGGDAVSSAPSKLKDVGIEASKKISE